MRASRETGVLHPSEGRAIRLHHPERSRGRYIRLRFTRVILSGARLTRAVERISGEPSLSMTPRRSRVGLKHGSLRRRPLRMFCTIFIRGRRAVPWCRRVAVRQRSTARLTFVRRLQMLPIQRCHKLVTPSCPLVKGEFGRASRDRACITLSTAVADTFDCGSPASS